MPPITNISQMKLKDYKNNVLMLTENTKNEWQILLVFRVGFLLFLLYYSTTK